jgi:sugar lactone lactonase YvrE
MLRDLSDLASGELNDGVVAPNGDLWFTLQHPFRAPAKHLANVGHLNRTHISGREEAGRNLKKVMRPALRKKLAGYL